MTTVPPLFPTRPLDKANWYEYNNNTDGMLLHCIGGAHVFPNLQVLDLPDIDDQHEIDRDLLRSNVATVIDCSDSVALMALLGCIHPKNNNLILTSRVTRLVLEAPCR